MTANAPTRPVLTGVYGIYDPDLLAPGRPLAETIVPALEAGIAVLQLRRKSGSADHMDQERALLALCRSYGIPFLINDDVALCREIGADGVHLGQQDMPLAEARRLLGPEAIIGVTCHQSLELALAAQNGGADYVAFGRFFPSASKPQAPLADPAILRRSKQRLSLPVVAIGGINADNGQSLIAAGADMLAVIQGLFGADDVTTSATSLVDLFKPAN